MNISFQHLFNKFKKTVIALLLGFLIFAPPGTLLGIGFLVVTFTGNIWIIVGGSIFLLIVGSWLFIKGKRTFLIYKSLDK